MKCRDCGQDILQVKPQMCPYCRSKNLIEEDTSKERSQIEQLVKAGHYEEAALRFEGLDLWDNAKECRRLSRKSKKSPTNLRSGNIGTIHILCPHCNASQPVNAKSTEAICNRCGTEFRIPEKLQELFSFEKK